jgi:hypothetical protein
MLTALYYPHTTISPGLVKNALFLWDRIEYIAPYDGFRPDYQDPELSEALQSFSVPLGLITTAKDWSLFLSR